MIYKINKKIGGNLRMEEKTIVAYQGKAFSVTLQSMIGSTNYGWCLTTMPEGVVLAGVENVPTTQGIGPVNQVFYFGAKDVPENPNVVLEFQLLCLSDFSKSSDQVQINVQLVPYNNENMDSNSFVQYSENTAIYNAQIPYGFVLNKTAAKSDNAYGDAPLLKYGYPSETPVLKYGYPCGDTTALKYGYPCGDTPTLKYGYPCGEDPTLKYGYPCGVEAALKYGYPCNNDPSLKYGYPCGDTPVLKYGYPCGDDPALKYGYPCGVDAVLKYGYPCNNDANLKYGYPCNNDVNLKYGYPCGVEATLKYGYPCATLKYGYPNC